MVENTEWYAAYVRDKRLAEAALRRLCLGAELVSLYLPGFPNIIGIEFGDNPYATQDKQFASYVRHRNGREVGLKIEGRWALLSTAPEASDEQEHLIAQELPKATEEQLHQLLTLRGDRIVAVRLGVTAAHLIVQFESGRILFVQGDHRSYESWQLGLDPPAGTGLEKRWLLVNMPGGDIAIWTPDDFDPDSDI